MFIIKTPKACRTASPIFVRKETGDTVPKNSKSTFTEAATELSRGFNVLYGTNYPDFYMCTDTDTPTYHFDVGTGEVLLQYSTKAKIITVVLYKNKHDDEPATIRYIMQKSYKDSQSIMAQVVEALFECVYQGNDIDYVIENVNAIIPKRPNFPEWFAEQIKNTGIFDKLNQ